MRHPANPDPMMLLDLRSRRDVLKGLLLTGSALALLGVLPLHAQQPADTPMKVPEQEMMAPDALPDVFVGKSDAPVTMVEYASMTCPHCAHFHATVYPWLVKNYIDTGKVRFVLREFPLDPLAAAAFMLARCEGPDKRNAVVDLLFDQQQNWAYNDKPLDALRNALRLTGMSKDQFDACLKDQKLQDQVYSVSDRGSKKFGVTATPTFFVNGEKVTGEVTEQSLAKILDPLVAKKS